MYKGMARETFLFVCLFVKYRNYLDLRIWIVVLDLSFFSFAFSYMLLHESGYSCYSIKVLVSNGFMRINNDTHNEDINVPRYYPIAFFKKIFLLILLCECMCLCTWLQVPVKAKKGSCNLLRLGLCELPYKGAENQTWTATQNCWVISPTLVSSFLAISSDFFFQMFMT